MKISVSRIKIEDRSAWEAMYYGYAEFYQVPMNDEILDTVWSWLFDGAYPFYGLIAKNEQGDAVGFMHCREMPSPLRGAKVGFLDDLFVKPEARGQGAVEALYDALNELASVQDWPFTRWITAENNYRGRAVYDKLADKTHWVTYQKATNE